MDKKGFAPSMELKNRTRVAHQEISMPYAPKAEKLGFLQEIEKWSIPDESAMNKSVLSDNPVLETMNSFDFSAMLTKRIPTFTPDIGLMPFDRIRRIPSETLFLKKNSSMDSY